jgi:hypothetical protein
MALAGGRPKWVDLIWGQPFRWSHDHNAAVRIAGLMKSFGDLQRGVDLDTAQHLRCWLQRARQTPS